MNKSDYLRFIRSHGHVAQAVENGVLITSVYWDRNTEKEGYVTELVPFQIGAIKAHLGY